MLKISITHSSESDKRNQKVQININGELFHREKANISVFDSYVIGGNNESGSLLTPWSRSIKDHYFNKYLIIDNS